MLYFAGYRQRADIFKHEEIEAATDQVIWSVDAGELIEARRPQDASFRGNVVQAMLAYAKGELGVAPVASAHGGEPHHRHRLGPDDARGAGGAARRAAAVPQARARGDRLHQLADAVHDEGDLRAVPPAARGSARPARRRWSSPAINQDQRLDQVDFGNLNQRLRGNTVLEKVADMYLAQLLKKAPGLRRV